ncbi:hypothetical protein CANCADRAFT_139248 [Tortispora caseinolytica NRRL Y-17796]|uniref:Histone-lysine N-methyltransferase SET9 n=1 Tax=Tortispora caseinolytica NRRL Y-17796 TaxID=767744 RepID=A0A1E4TCF1_9ASCO|nr:hypothetical protein CANCADRAFT_139248 [Tortispora caseinolytica NRRL Y-17796]
MNNHRLTCRELSLFDDFITDILIDNIYYWINVHKTDPDFQPVRRRSLKPITNFLRSTVIQRKDVNGAMAGFLRFAAVIDFILKFNPNDSERGEYLQAEFEKHSRRYLQMYHPDAPFEVCTTNAYMSRTNRVESSIVARRHIQSGESIQYLSGRLVPVVQDEDRYNFIEREGQDFSIVYSSRKNELCLMLGPARFINHDCSPNARFVSVQGNTYVSALRDIERGEEITVAYSMNYFGESNTDCLCHTCRAAAKGGYTGSKFDPLASDMLLDQVSDDSDFESLPPEDDTTPAASARRRNALRKKEKKIAIVREKLAASTLLTPPLSRQGSTESSVSETEHVSGRSRRIIKSPLESDITPQITRFQYSGLFQYNQPRLRCQNILCTLVFPSQLITTVDQSLPRFCPRCIRHMRLYHLHYPFTSEESWDTFRHTKSIPQIMRLPLETSSDIDFTIVNKKFPPQKPQPKPSDIIHHTYSTRRRARVTELGLLPAKRPTRQSPRSLTRARHSL